jgi:hypothetical protein
VKGRFGSNPEELSVRFTSSVADVAHVPGDVRHVPVADFVVTLLQLG